MGSRCIHRYAPSHNPPIKMPPSTFFPHPWGLYYISYKRQHGSACVLARPSAGFNPPEFWSSCGLAVSCCLATSSVRSRGLLSPRIFMVLGGMKAAFVPFTSRDLGVRGALIVLMGTLVCGWPQLGLISPKRFPSCSGYMLGSGVELN